MSNQYSSIENESIEGSDLLAELAGEATQKNKVLQSEEQYRQERSQNLHAALNKIFQYFSQFSSHLNKIKPTTPRGYNVDPRTAYSNIQWGEVRIDSRKQSLSDKALIDHVSMLVKLTATKPVLTKRRWNELDSLSKELSDLGLRPIEDLNVQARRQPQQEIFELELAPDFQMRIQFQGNYDTGKIDLLSNNFDGFGLAAHVLDPADVNQKLLDEIGRFLIGRNNSLPEIMSRTRFKPQYAIYR